MKKNLNPKKWIVKNTYATLLHSDYFNPNAKKKESYSIVTFSKKGTVATVALTTNNEVLLLRQYRVAANKTIVNLSGGRIDKNKSKKQQIKEEVETETGHVFSKIKKFYDEDLFQNPTRITDSTRLFIAYNGEKKFEPKLESAESGLQVISVKLREIKKLLLGKNKVRCKCLWPSKTADILKLSEMTDTTTVMALSLLCIKSKI